MNVSRFGKYDPFFNFHDANFPTKAKKIMIPKYNAVSYFETETFFLLLSKTISICQALTNRVRAYVTYSKS